MAKKKKRSKIQIKPDPKKKYIEILLFYTERNITGSGDSVDQLFSQQAKRLREALKSL